MLPFPGPIPLEVLSQNKELSFFEGFRTGHDFPQNAALGV
jgi:hypothetical protein